MSRSRDLGLDPVGYQRRDPHSLAWKDTSKLAHLVALEQGREHQAREVFDEAAIDRAYLAGVLAGRGEANDVACQRTGVVEFDRIRCMSIAAQAFADWADTPANWRWHKKIEGTPLTHELPMHIAIAISESIRAASIAREILIAGQAPERAAAVSARQGEGSAA